LLPSPTARPNRTSRPGRIGRLINVDRILIKTASSLETPLATEQIAALLRQRHNIGPRQADDFNIRELADASK